MIYVYMCVCYRLLSNVLYEFRCSVCHWCKCVYNVYMHTYLLDTIVIHYYYCGVRSILFSIALNSIEKTTISVRK